MRSGDAMSCDSIRQDLLDRGWTRGDRQAAAALLKHLEACPACRSAAEEYEQLRDVLRDPDRKIQPEGGWRGFEEKLQRELAPHSGRWSLAMPMRIAAVVLIGAVTFQLGRYVAAPRTIPPASAPRGNGISFSSPEVAREARAFSEVAQAFDGRASWVMVANGASDLGLAPEPVIMSQRLLLLRLVMSRDKAVVSSADLAIVPGQTAKLALPLPQGRKLNYTIGTSADQPTRLSLWAEVQTPRGGQTLALLATSVDAEGDGKLTAGRLATDAGTYELNIGFSGATLPGGAP